MSSNRLIYEKCSENLRDKRNVDQASWIFEELRFNNNTECMADMPDTNAFGKTTVKGIRGNLGLSSGQKAFTRTKSKYG